MDIRSNAPAGPELIELRLGDQKSGFDAHSLAFSGFSFEPLTVSSRAIRVPFCFSV